MKSTITETAEQVADRIRKLLRVVPADRLGVTTDCGLILLQRYIAKDKLHAMVEGAKIVRDDCHPAPKRNGFAQAARRRLGATVSFSSL